MKKIYSLFLMCLLLIIIFSCEEKPYFFYDGQNDNFSVEVPTTNKDIITKTYKGYPDIGINKINTYTFDSKDADRVYMLRVMHYTEKVQTIEQAKERLMVALENIYQAVYEGKYRQQQIDNKLALEIVIKVMSGQTETHQKIILTTAGNKLYQLQVVAYTTDVLEDEISQHFFDTFHCFE